MNEKKFQHACTLGDVMCKECGAGLALGWCIQMVRAYAPGELRPTRHQEQWYATFNVALGGSADAGGLELG